MKWFGETWGAPVCAITPHVETPVGAQCMYCPIAIEDGDRGFLLPHVGDGVVIEVVVHHACLIHALIPDGWGRAE